jgi:tetratricopeptide (TPR) repeat protein
MRRPWIFEAALAIAIVAVYAIGLDGPFIFDSIPHIVDNRSIHSFTTVLDGGYQETRPVFLLSLAANYAVGGHDPLGYRVVNVALHLACALLLYVLLRRSAQRLRWFPELAAAVFALHPLATESVTYVNSRSGVLAAAFGLSAMLLYLRFHDSRRKRAWIGSFLCMAIAMGCKESAVVFPVLLFAFVTVFRHGGKLRDALRSAAPMIPLALCIAIVPVLFAVATNPHQGTIGAGTLPVVDHALTQVRVVALLAYRSAVPVEQNLDHDFAVSTGVDGGVVASALALALIVGLAVWQRRCAWPVLLGCAWFLIALAPTNSIVPFKDFIAERHLYVSLAGFAMIAGWGLAKAIEVRRAFGAAAAIYLLALAGLTVARNRVLSDPLELWAQTVAASPDKARPHVNLGILLVEAGDEQAGGAHLQRAVELDPDDHRAQFNAGVFWQGQGDLERAVPAFRAAAQIAPRRRYLTSLARSANNLGIARFDAGAIDEAGALFEDAIAADAGYAKAHYNLAEVELRRGRTDEARRLLERTLELAPKHAKARARLERLTTRPDSP